MFKLTNHSETPLDFNLGPLGVVKLAPGGGEAVITEQQHEALDAAPAFQHYVDNDDITVEQVAAKRGRKPKADGEGESTDDEGQNEPA